MSSPSNEEEEINLKILILGDSSVGKTSLLLKYVDGYFPTIYVATIGVEYKIKTININDCNINLQIWDTAGQERFRSITQSFLKGADGIMYVYDITSKSSFDNLRTWIGTSDESVKEVKKIIIGNKSDLENNRIISKESLQKFCKDKSLNGIEVSAKSGSNVNEAFYSLAKIIVGNMSKEEIIKNYSERTRERGLSIKSEKQTKKEKRNCC